MLPSTHLYCAKQIYPSGNSFIYYGSIFPDIPSIGLIAWDTMKKETSGFSDYLQTQTQDLAHIGFGLLLHEESYGIDRFVHGDSGYAYTKGMALHEMLDTMFPKELIPTVAHNFIEFAVDFRMQQRYPSMKKDMEKVITAIDNRVAPLAQSFAHYFKTNPEKTIKDIKAYNQFLQYDITTPEKALDFITSLTNRLRHANYAAKDIEPIWQLADKTIEDNYEDFLKQTIDNCQNDLQTKGE